MENSEKQIRRHPMEIIIALVSIVIGFAIGRILPRERPIGDLRVDQSDPTSAPCLFLELGTDVQTIMRKKRVTFGVKVEDFLPHK